MRQVKMPDTFEGRGAWMLAWIATQQYPTGDRAQTLTLRRLKRAVKKGALVTVPDPEKAPDVENVKLRPGGADLFLEEAEYAMLVKAIDQLRQKLNGADVDPLGLLDELLIGAKEIASDEVERLIASLDSKALPPGSPPPTLPPPATK
jgi:hypothetical protein